MAKQVVGVVIWTVAAGLVPSKSFLSYSDAHHTLHVVKHMFAIIFLIRDVSTVREINAHIANLRQETQQAHDVTESMLVDQLSQHSLSSRMTVSIKA